MTKGSKFDDFLKDENIEIDEEKIKENIKQMTDKEIIIDGVDVSECEFYTTMEDCVGIHDLCEQLDDYCSIKKDCYYKQLKRLEQENAELKAYMDVNEDFKTAWKELKAENERLKEKIIKLSEEKGHLIVENNTLKEELDFLKDNTYREALREIREYINDNTDFDKGDYFQSKTAAYDILQIIALYGE